MFFTTRPINRTSLLAFYQFVLRPQAQVSNSKTSVSPPPSSHSTMYVSISSFVFMNIFLRADADDRAGAGADLPHHAQRQAS